MKLVLMGISLIIALINIYLCIKNNKFVHISIVISLCLGIATLYVDYSKVCDWVVSNDVVALLDVVPSMTKILLYYAIALISINLVALIISSIKKN